MTKADDHHMQIVKTVKKMYCNLPIVEWEIVVNKLNNDAL